MAIRSRSICAPDITGSERINLGSIRNILLPATTRPAIYRVNRLTCGVDAWHALRTSPDAISAGSLTTYLQVVVEFSVPLVPEYLLVNSDYVSKVFAVVPYPESDYL